MASVQGGGPGAGQVGSSTWVGHEHHRRPPETHHVRHHRPPVRHGPSPTARPPSTDRGGHHGDRPLARPGGRPPRRASVLPLCRAVLASRSSDRRRPGSCGGCPTASRSIGTGSTSTSPRRRAPLGLGDRMGKNSPFRRALLAPVPPSSWPGPTGPGRMAVRTRIPPLPLRHLCRLPESLQASHRRWLVEHQLPEPEQMRRRARRLAVGLWSEGRTREDARAPARPAWQFHPAVAFRAAEERSDVGPERPDACPGPAPAPGGRGRSGTVGVRDSPRVVLVTGGRRGPSRPWNGSISPLTTLSIIVQIGRSSRWRPASSRATVAVLTPSATMCISARMSSSRRPFPNCSPTRRLRLCGLMQVAIRSPIPARPANAAGWAPMATPSRVNSARPRDITAAWVLSPDAQSLTDAGGDGDDVLERAADLAPDDVVVQVDAEDAPGDHLLDRPGHFEVLGGDDGGGRLAGHDLVGQVRPGEGGHRMPGDHLFDHLGHPEIGTLLQPLGQADHRDPRAACRAPPPRGRRGTPMSAPRRSPGRRRRRRRPGSRWPPTRRAGRTRGGTRRWCARCRWPWPPPGCGPTGSCRGAGPPARRPWSPMNRLPGRRSSPGEPTVADGAMPGPGDRPAQTPPGATSERANVSEVSRATRVLTPNPVPPLVRYRLFSSDRAGPAMSRWAHGTSPTNSREQHGGGDGAGAGPAGPRCACPRPRVDVPPVVVGHRQRPQFAHRPGPTGGGAPRR